MSDVELKLERAESADVNVLQAAQPVTRKPGKRPIRVLPMLITFAAIGVAIGLGRAMWDTYMVPAWARDGVVRAYVLTMTPEVSGRIAEMPVVDNQFVHKGELLM